MVPCPVVPTTLWGTVVSSRKGSEATVCFSLFWVTDVIGVRCLSPARARVSCLTKTPRVRVSKRVAFTKAALRALGRTMAARSSWCQGWGLGV